MKIYKSNQYFRKRLFILNLIFILIITITSLFIVYYWSFYHFKNIFEDRVIDEYTLKNAESLGIENEWILGVSTHSVDVLELTYGKEVSEHIKKNALTQDEIYKLYTEKVDGKDVIYTIALDNKDGEFLYKYSVIKNIYIGIFPKLLLTFFIFSCFLGFISYIYIKFISKHFYSSIDKLKDYAQNLEKLNLGVTPLDIETNDVNLNKLAKTFKNMHIKLCEKDDLQNATLQYISHEMKTPVMIIESYAVSAKVGIYPNGNLESSLNTILNQTDRIKIKVQSLLQFTKLSSKDIKKENFIISEVFDIVLSNYKVNIEKVKNFKFIINRDIEIFADKENFQILIENLIENQLKYCDNFISIRVFEKTDKLVMLFFNDGEIIDNDLKKLLFMPFSKGYNGSNGLGLSICKAILSYHKGNIELLNNKKGVLFKIEIPKIYNKNS